MDSEIICGLDIGGSSIKVLIGQFPYGSSKKSQQGTFNPSENILGFSESPVRGFSKGVVTNLSLLSDAVEETISKAEKSARCRVRRVITNISGAHIRTFKSRGSVHISDRPSEITERDIKRCVESARLIAMSLDREVVHLAPERFYIDDKIKIDDPRGLFGSKLDVDLNIVTSLVSILQNLAKAVNLAGYEVEDVLLSASGTALALFDEKELEHGAIIIDVGSDLTEAALFMEKKLKDCFYFPFGSNDLTQVLQDKLKIMFKEAEDLRIRYGTVARDSSGLFDDQIVVPGIGRAANTVSRREISNMLLPKLEEIMQDVYKNINPFLKQRKELPYVAIVGGVSKMDGFVEAIEDIFGVPAQMGRIKNAKDIHDVNFACSLGLLRYGARKRKERKGKRALAEDNYAVKVISKVRSLFSDYF